MTTDDTDSDAATQSTERDDVSPPDSLVWEALVTGSRNDLEEAIKLGGSVRQEDEGGRTPLHLAVGAGSEGLVRTLLDNGAEPNARDCFGNAPLHHAATLGLPHMCSILHEKGAKLEEVNKSGHTALHIAACEGNNNFLIALLNLAAECNSPDELGNSPLHLAVFSGHESVTKLLLKHGADPSAPNSVGDTPLHLAAQQSNLRILHSIVTSGSKLNAANSEGDTALHVAADAGMSDVCRLLLLSGAALGPINSKRFTPTMSACEAGHLALTSMLDRLDESRIVSHAEMLQVSDEYLSEVKVKVFGDSAVGKTTLIQQLRSSLFKSISNWLWPRRSVQSDATDEELAKTFGVVHAFYTPGIAITPITLQSGVTLNFWEFGGFDRLRPAYDFFLGELHCINMVLYEANKPLALQYEQLDSWCSLLAATASPRTPFNRGGHLSQKAPLVVIAVTHNAGARPDTADCERHLARHYSHCFSLPKSIFWLDLKQPAAGVKVLKTHLTALHSQIGHSLPRPLRCLPRVLDWITEVSSHLPEPVLSWKHFVSGLQDNVNPLITTPIATELCLQLQQLGRVLFLETEGAPDQVVLNPSWLSHHVLGSLLGHNMLANAPTSGCFHADDHLLALISPSTNKLLQCLRALELAVQCTVDGSCYQWEVPALISYSAPVLRWPDGVYKFRSAVAIVTASPLLKHLFPRIQLRLRVAVEKGGEELYQYGTASRVLYGGGLEVVVQLEEENRISITVMIASLKLADAAVYARERVRGVVQQFLADRFPFLRTSLHFLSSDEQMVTSEELFSYSDDTAELARVLCFSQPRLVHDFSLLSHHSVSNLTASRRTLATIQHLCAAMDAPDELGRDWPLLASRLQLDSAVRLLDSSQLSPTEQLLMRSPHLTVGELVAVLRRCEREDVARALISFSPPYIYQPSRLSRHKMTSATESESELSDELFLREPVEQVNGVDSGQAGLGAGEQDSAV